MTPIVVSVMIVSPKSPLYLSAAERVNAFLGFVPTVLGTLRQRAHLAASTGS
jgi:hypothetical protein